MSTGLVIQELTNNSEIKKLQNKSHAKISRFYSTAMVIIPKFLDVACMLEMRGYSEKSEIYYQFRFII